MSKNEILKNLPNKIDYSLPKEWVDEVIKLTGEDPIPHFVWYYPTGCIFGYPLPITLEGFNILKMSVGWGW